MPAQSKPIDHPFASCAQTYEAPKDIQDARRIQQELRSKISLVSGPADIKLVAGVDCSYDIPGNLSRAFIVLMTVADLKPIASVEAELPTAFPYVPGFLAFREIPVILEALASLERKPDLLMVDGQGVAHPRRMGIAAHLGVLLDMPAIGVAKSRLFGHYAEPGLLKGDSSPLYDGKEHIGAVLRSKEKTLPLFISAGHLIDQETALALTLRCLTRYRLPEPTRIADKISKIKRGEAEALLF